MHSAPAVRYPVGRSRWHGLLLLGLSGLGLLAVILWTLSLDTPGWRQGLFVLLFVPAVALAWRQWWRWLRRKAARTQRRGSPQPRRLQTKRGSPFHGASHQRRIADQS